MYKIYYKVIKIEYNYKALRCLLNTDCSNIFIILLFLVTILIHVFHLEQETIFYVVYITFFFIISINQLYVKNFLFMLFMIIYLYCFRILRFKYYLFFFS